MNIKIFSCVIALLLSSCINAENNQSQEPMVSIEVPIDKNNHNLYAQQIAVGAFLAYHSKVTDGYKEICDKQGHDINSYFTKVKLLESDLIEKAERFDKAHPELYIAHDVKASKERILQAAHDDFKNEGISCSLVNHKEAKIISFREKLPGFADLILDLP